MRIFDPEVLVRDLRCARLLGRRRNALEADDGNAQRHHPGHRPDRLGQDHDAVLHAQAAGDARGQCVHASRTRSRWSSRRSTRCRCSTDIDLGFAEGVRALMRQDPDIIMVGEIRDLETAEMAIQAALTGHLVLSTLHTNDAPSAVTRAARPGRAGLPDQRRRCSASWRSAWCARCARTARRRCRCSRGQKATWTALVAPWKSNEPAQLLPSGRLSRMPHDRLQRAASESTKSCSMSPEMRKASGTTARSRAKMRDLAMPRRHDARCAFRAR